MLDHSNFTKEHIKQIQIKSKRDPALIERTIFAFGLLEAISRVGMPFIFKGGTCLMLLLDQIKRLSTDIDIVVEPGTPIEEYFKQASVIFPFVRYEEQKRVGVNNIEKRHIKFTYNSPVNGREFYILLDVIYETNPYTQIIEKEIRNDLLISKPDNIKVKIPSPECMLGDKMTAFAPHTIGIPINSGKDLEVIKQFYDVCSLLDDISNFDMVSATYNNIVPIETSYRGININTKDVAEDTFRAAACIASRGKICEDDYPFYVRGMRDIRNHVFVENYTPEIAAIRAPKVMYLAACLMTGSKYSRTNELNENIDSIVLNNELAALRYLRKINMESYLYVIKVNQLL